MGNLTEIYCVHGLVCWKCYPGFAFSCNSQELILAVEMRQEGMDKRRPWMAGRLLVAAGRKGREQTRLTKPPKPRDVTLSPGRECRMGGGFESLRLEFLNPRFM